MSKHPTAKRYTFPTPMSVGIAMTAVIRAYGYHCHSPQPYTPHSCTYLIGTPHDANDLGGYTITRKPDTTDEYLVTIDRNTSPHLRTLIERARTDTAEHAASHIHVARRTKSPAAA